MDTKTQERIKKIARDHLGIDEIYRNGHMVIVNNVLAPKVIEALVEAYYLGHEDAWIEGCGDA